MHQDCSPTRRITRLNRPNTLNPDTFLGLCNVGSVNCCECWRWLNKCSIIIIIFWTDLRVESTHERWTQISVPPPLLASLDFCIIILLWYATMTIIRVSTFWASMSNCRYSCSPYLVPGKKPPKSLVIKSSHSLQVTPSLTLSLLNLSSSSLPDWVPSNTAHQQPDETQRNSIAVTSLTTKQSPIVCTVKYAKLSSNINALAQRTGECNMHPINAKITSIW